MSEIQTIIREAQDASADAAFAHLVSYGDNADVGGAYVVVSGRSAIARHFKAQRFGQRHHRGGYGFPVVPRISCQSRAVYEKAADAYVAVLQRHGIEAHTYSYAD